MERKWFCLFPEPLLVLLQHPFLTEAPSTKISALLSLFSCSSAAHSDISTTSTFHYCMVPFFLIAICSDIWKWVLIARSLLVSHWNPTCLNTNSGFSTTDSLQGWQGPGKQLWQDLAFCRGCWHWGIHPQGEGLHDQPMKPNLHFLPSLWVALGNRLLLLSRWAHLPTGCV